MNQEEKVINVHLEKREDLDYLIFEFEEESAVCLNDESSQRELKCVFSKILREIVNSSVKLEFIDMKGYNVGLYSDVCKEYIKELNREISNTRKNMPEKLIIKRIV